MRNALVSRHWHIACVACFISWLEKKKTYITCVVRLFRVMALIKTCGAPFFLVMALKTTYITTQCSALISPSGFKGLVKKYGGGGGGGGPDQRGGGSWGFEPCARGGSCNFQLPPGGGSPYFLLTTNATVDYTCYIKHSQLELLLKYSQTCCARKYKGWQAAHLYGRGTLFQTLFFFGSNEHVL